MESQLDFLNFMILRSIFINKKNARQKKLASLDGWQSLNDKQLQQFIEIRIIYRKRIKRTKQPKLINNSQAINSQANNSQAVKQNKVAEQRMQEIRTKEK